MIIYLGRYYGNSQALTRDQCPLASWIWYVCVSTCSNSCNNSHFSNREKSLKNNVILGLQKRQILYQPNIAQWRVYNMRSKHCNFLAHLRSASRSYWMKYNIYKRCTKCEYDFIQFMPISQIKVDIVNIPNEHPQKC